MESHHFHILCANSLSVPQLHVVRSDASPSQTAAVPRSATPALAVPKQGSRSRVVRMSPYHSYQKQIPVLPSRKGRPTILYVSPFMTHTCAPSNQIPRLTSLTHLTTVHLHFLSLLSTLLATVGAASLPKLGRCHGQRDNYMDRSLCRHAHAADSRFFRLVSRFASFLKAYQNGNLSAPVVPTRVDSW